MGRSPADMQYTPARSATLYASDERRASFLSTFTMGFDSSTSLRSPVMALLATPSWSTQGEANGGAE